ncbi:HAD family hydrolase [Corticibacter populi]|uniref:HAD family hydrolase n=1 Tax=Corticibacter populi TaxID=1550736 RepID=A0A3M6R0Y3_9BURK|nr:HAD-IA family hydrolase [Corticibacter populi]RMX08920.1 HAD family hydrolase [Corticibacter populi]
MIDIHRIRAISLDLDDTLWPVWPTIRKAEATLQAWLREEAPATATLWQGEGVAQAARQRVEQRHPQRAYDLSFLRLEMIREMLRQAGDDPALAEPGFELFFAVRQQVEPFEEVEAALQALAARYPLLALSNGNAQVLQMPIGRYFTASISARDVGVAKPDARIFRLAAERAGLPAQALLHVGDDPDADVQGARAAGMQALWVNREGRDWPGAAGAQEQSGPVSVRSLDGMLELLGARA